MKPNKGRRRTGTPLISLLRKWKDGGDDSPLHVFYRSKRTNAPLFAVLNGKIVKTTTRRHDPI